MTFSRMPKTSLPGQIYGPTKQVLRQRYVEPAVDPYTELPSAGRYDPSTGKISGSLTDTRRKMKRREEASRSRRERAENRYESLHPGIHLIRPEEQLRSDNKKSEKHRESQHPGIHLIRPEQQLRSDNKK